MLINFCNEGFVDVECASPCCDDNSFSNLISLDLYKRKNGFLVANFVKPPVDIVFKFKCRIHLDRIIINRSLGTQKSSVIQIVAEDSEGNQRILAKQGFDHEKRTICFHRNSSDVPKDPTRYTYVILSHGWLLSKIKTVIIRICRTESSTLPALGGIDIWGHISRLEPKTVVNNTIALWKKISSKIKEVCPSAKQEQPSAHIKPPISNEEKDTFGVPEDFLDSITYSVLTVPMMLPSGKVVDLSTLEKLNKCEEKLGRKPCDPFTGLPFTESRKPTFAASLKVRLDKFLLENCDQPEIKEIPRTVGRKNVFIASADPPYCPSSSSFAGPSNIKRSRDVDSLLESSLAGLPSFLEKPVEKKTRSDCIKCNGTNTLFEITCGHILCRACLHLLRNSNRSKCSCNCDIDFKSVKRYHPASAL